MAVNILDLFKNQVAGQLASASAGFLGETESNTKNVLESLAPALLGSLVQKGATESGASSILNMLNQDNYDTNVLGDISNLTTGGESKLNSIMNMGLPIVRNLLGDKLGGIVDWVSDKNNVKSSSVSSLLSLAAPYLLGLINRVVKNENLSASGLKDLLSNQGSWVRSLLPAGLSGLLNFSTTPEPEFTRATPATPVRNDINNNSGGGLGKFLPWLLLLLGIALLWYLLKGCRDNQGDTTMENTENVGDSIANDVDNAMDSAGAAINNAVDVVQGKLNDLGDWVADLGPDYTVKLPDGKELRVYERSVERNLVDWINSGAKTEDELKNKWFSFDRLYFEKGKSTLTADSKAQLDNIAAILKAYPNVNIKLGGYTDSDGDDKMNMDLSRKRAEIAKTELQKLGIGGGRLAAEGYGEQFPICAANDTPECKAQNRRIDIRVSKM